MAMPAQGLTEVTLICLEYLVDSIDRSPFSITVQLSYSTTADQYLSYQVAAEWSIIAQDPLKTT